MTLFVSTPKAKLHNHFLTCVSTHAELWFVHISRKNSLACFTSRVVLVIWFVSNQHIFSLVSGGNKWFHANSICTGTRSTKRPSTSCKKTGRNMRQWPYCTNFDRQRPECSPLSKGRPDFWRQDGSTSEREEEKSKAQNSWSSFLPCVLRNLD